MSRRPPEGPRLNLPAPFRTARRSVQHTFRALRIRNYKLFWFGQLASLTGTWAQEVAQAWLVLKLTNSPLVLGMMVTVRFAPVSYTHLRAHETVLDLVCRL